MVANIELCLVLDVAHECLSLLLESLHNTVLDLLNFGRDPLFELVFKLLLSIYGCFQRAELAKRDEKSLLLDESLNLLHFEDVLFRPDEAILGCLDLD